VLNFLAQGQRLIRRSSVLNPSKFISVMVVKVNKQRDVGGDRELSNNKGKMAFSWLLSKEKLSRGVQANNVE